MGNGYLTNILKRLLSYKELEVIVSDGGSEDGTLEFLKKLPILIIEGKVNSRAHRLNLGAEVARGAILLFHHPRSLIEASGIEFLLDNSENLSWGGFTHQFDKKHPLLKFTSWYSNNIRSKKSGIVYLDHCIFLPKTMFETIGFIPPVDIFEDTILSKRLLKHYGLPTIISHFSITSAIRFEKNGVFKQALLNQYMKALFLLGFKAQVMNKIYEKNTALNSRYPKYYPEQLAPPKTQNSAQKR
jgi:glycosyltransferase involved in cell wall biosynthesis